MATVGYTTIGTLIDATGTSSSNNPVGAMVTMTESGDMTKITGYVANTLSSSSSNCTIYTGGAGARNSSIVARTTFNTVTTTFGLVDFTFSSVFGVTAQTYWIQFNGDGGNGPGGDVGQIKYDIGGAANTSYNDNDFQIPVYGSNQYTLYATYNPAGVSSVLGWNIALK